MSAEEPQPEGSALIRSFHVMAKPAAHCATSIARTAIICTSRTCCPRRLPAGFRTNCSRSLSASASPDRTSIQSSSPGTGASPRCWGRISIEKRSSCSRSTPRGKKSRNNLQTNGLLLDESWCEFLKGHDFRVGLSIDGPKEMHDFFRRSKDGSSSFDAAFQAARLLRQYGVRFGAMAVVDSVTARHPVEVYRFLTEELGARRVQSAAASSRRPFARFARGGGTPPKCRSWELRRPGPATQRPKGKRGHSTFSLVGEVKSR